MNIKSDIFYILDNIEKRIADRLYAYFCKLNNHNNIVDKKQYKSIIINEIGNIVFKMFANHKRVELYKKHYQRKFIDY